MATAVDTPAVVAKPINPNSDSAIPFAANLRSDDISACEEIKASPGAGKSLVLQSLVISTDSAITITIGEGETGGAVTTTIMGPIAFAANTSLAWTFAQPVKLTANTELTCDASGAGVVNLFIEGYTV